VQGWAPAERAAALRELAQTKGLALTIEPPGADDAPPTLLDNAPALRGGEDLLTFYTMPAYGAWDPSSAVLVAFAFFFAVIFADAGYSLLLAGILGFLWKRLGAGAHNRSLRTMMLIVVAFSLAYGVIAGSYFGITPAPDSFLGMLHVLDTGDQALMMWLSIVVGAVHIVASNLVSSWRKRGRAAALGPFGWAAIIAGGACVGIGSSYPAFAVLGPIGRASLVAGAALVLLFSSDRPFSFAPKQLFFRLVDGIKGATQLTKAFGDVLSYLRLFALGLAAFKLAEVFNGMAASAFEIKGVGVLLGVLILLIGHGLNFVMGIMSGVVHSLRLNLIEFLSWSLTEEGRPFAPFAKKANKQ
jgi:V/A-type H+-transporting ATPase subunit I